MRDAPKGALDGGRIEQDLGGGRGSGHGFLGDLAGSPLKEPDGERQRVISGMMPLLPPSGAMFYDPIEESFLESDVVARFLALQPFVAEDFLPFGEEFFVEPGFFDELGIFVCGGAHIFDGIISIKQLSRQRF